MPKGYLIVRVRIDDLEQYKKYMALSPGVIAQFGGRFLVRGGQHVTVEGEEETMRLVMVEYPSYQAAQDCYHSDAYQEIKALRIEAGEAQFVCVEGFEE